MSTRLEEYVLKANEFVGQVAKQLGNPEDHDRAGRITLSVLHTVRDFLSGEESLHLIGQLPLYIKAAYADGWKVDADQTNLDSTNSFLGRLRSQNNFLAEKDFGREEDATQNVNAVFSVLKKYTSQGTLQHILTRLPAGLVQPESKVKPEMHAEL